MTIACMFISFTNYRDLYSNLNFPFPLKAKLQKKLKREARLNMPKRPRNALIFFIKDQQGKVCQWWETGMHLWTHFSSSAVSLLCENDKFMTLLTLNISKYQIQILRSQGAQIYLRSNGFDQFFSCFKVENIIFFKNCSSSWGKQNWSIRSVSEKAILSYEAGSRFILNLTIK